MRANCLLLSIGCMALAACGSGAARHHASGAGRASASAKRSPAGAGASPPSAQSELASSARALAGARSYEMHGTITQNGSTLRLRLAIASKRNVEMSFASSGMSVQVLLVAGSAYLRASKAFWSAHGGARTAGLANRWVEVPAGSVGGLSASLGPFSPGTLARCLAEDHGTLSLAGRASVAGRTALIIRDAGNAPGAAPGTLAVAAAGAPYPLRVTEAGRQRPGGRIDVCNDGRGGEVRGSLILSHFDAVPPIKAPSTSTRLNQQTLST